MDRLREELGQARKSTKSYTVQKAVDDWLASGLPGRAESTRTTYRYAAAPLVAKIGHRPLRDLTSSEVRIALAGLTGTLSTRTLVITRLSLERAITFAMSHDRVAKNVVVPVGVPEGKAGRRSKSLILAQARDLLAAAEGERLHSYVVVSLLGGLRTEEVRALRWDHVDLEAGTVAVWRSVRASGDTKTPKSGRSLQLPQVAVEALRRQREQQDRDRHIAGDRWQEQGLVFASAVGTPLPAGNVRRAFRSVCSRAGIAGQWTPRELRHTFVSLMSQTGMAIEEISHLVGHASSHTTETIYRSELRPVIRTGANAIDKLFPATSRWSQVQ